MMDMHDGILLVLIFTYFAMTKQIYGQPADCTNGGTPLNRNTCICPGGLIGTNCDQSLYISFDTLDNGFDQTLMQGNDQVVFDALVPGQVNSAVNLVKDESQWIDLGFHPEVCLAHKYICGIHNGGVGGAFSMWLNIIDCSGEGGIMVTEENERFRQTGFNMFCARDDNSLWYTLTVRRAEYNRHFEGFMPERWFHVVFNYIGPREDEGYRVYHDGVEVTDGPGGIASQPGFRSPAKDARIVIGRRYTEQGGQYTSLRMDELLFCNRPLTNNEIETLSQ